MKAIMTGSFDPITVGHMEIIKKASHFAEKMRLGYLRGI